MTEISLIVTLNNQFNSTQRISVHIELGDLETYSLDVVSIGHVLYLSLYSVR